MQFALPTSRALRLSTTASLFICKALNPDSIPSAADLTTGARVGVFGHSLASTGARSLFPERGRALFSHHSGVWDMSLWAQAGQWALAGRAVVTCALHLRLCCYCDVCSLCLSAGPGSDSTSGLQRLLPQAWRARCGCGQAPGSCRGGSSGDSSTALVSGSRQLRAEMPV